MDLDTRLAECDPARHARLGGPESAAADRLYRQITRPARTPAPARRDTRRRIVVGAVAGAAAAGLAVGVTLASLPGAASPGTAGQHPAAAGPLELVAKVAARQAADQSPGAGQFLYSKLLLSGVPGSAIPAGTATVQAWLTGDGHGRYAARVCTPGCATLAGAIPGSKDRGDTAATPYAVWGFPLVSPGSVAGLPDSPAALMPVLTRYATQEFPSYPGELGIVETAGSFLATAASPAVRAALYRTVEQLPGVQDLGRVTDRLGRSGIAVAFTSRGLREELVYDPATSAVLQTETVVAAPGGLHLPLKPASVMKKLSPRERENLTLNWPHGEVLSSVVYAASGVVNSDTATSPAPAG